MLIFPDLPDLQVEEVEDEKWRSLPEKGELGHLAHPTRLPLQLYSKKHRKKRT